MTLHFHCYSTCFTVELFHNKITKLKAIFDKCLQTFLNKISYKEFCNKDVQQHAVHGKGVYISLSYLGMLPLSTRSYLQKTIHEIFPFITLKVVFWTKNHTYVKKIKIPLQQYFDYYYILYYIHYFHYSYQVKVRLSPSKKIVSTAWLKAL